MEEKKRSKPTCSISSSPGCTSSPKPSMKAQRFPLAAATPDARSTLQKSQPRIRESWNQTKFHCHPQECYKKK
jgi:hypothetical protein